MLMRHRCQVNKVCSESETSVCFLPARADNRLGLVSSVVLASSSPQILASEGGVARVAVVFRCTGTPGTYPLSADCGEGVKGALLGSSDKREMQPRKGQQ